MVKKFSQIYENNITTSPIYYKGYEIIDPKYDKPSYKQSKEERLKFIKDNIDKIEQSTIIDKMYKELLNYLNSESKFMDEDVNGYVIVGKKQDGTKVVYAGDIEKKVLGYKHINFTTYDKENDIIYNRTLHKPVIFKYKRDANKKMNELKKEDELYTNIWDIKMKVIEVKLSKYYTF